jgi:hypothetical protein
MHFSSPYMPCPSHPPWFVDLNKKDQEYKLWRSSLCHFLHFPVTSLFLGLNILFSTLFWNAFNLCPYLTVRHKVSHPYKTTGKIIVYYTIPYYTMHLSTIILKFLYSCQESKGFWTAW